MNSLFGVPLLFSAFLFGFRHGIDWDHIAAIVDIVGTSSVTSQSGEQVIARPNRVLLLASSYAAGHGFAIAALACGASIFAAKLPSDLSAYFEKFVGLSLLIFGCCVLWNVANYARGKSDFKMQSRWLPIIHAVQKLIHWCKSGVSVSDQTQELQNIQYGGGTAFGIGIIHGLGAETATQLLLIAAIEKTANTFQGAALLTSFVVGFVLSNAAVAGLTFTGLISAAQIKPLAVSIGIVAALFSLWIGVVFAFGLPESLPELAPLLGG